MSTGISKLIFSVDSTTVRGKFFTGIFFAGRFFARKNKFPEADNSSPEHSSPR
jgi:hypothetical protein